MIAVASSVENQAVAGRRARVKLWAEAVEWVEGIAGEYRSRELGSLVVRHREGGIRAGSRAGPAPWGIKEQSSGRPLVALVGPGLIPRRTTGPSCSIRDNRSTDLRGSNRRELSVVVR